MFNVLPFNWLEINGSVLFVDKISPLGCDFGNTSEQNNTVIDYFPIHRCLLEWSKSSTAFKTILNLVLFETKYFKLVVILWLNNLLILLLDIKWQSLAILPKMKCLHIKTNLAEHNSWIIWKLAFLSKLVLHLFKLIRDFRQLR